MKRVYLFFLALFLVTFTAGIVWNLLRDRMVSEPGPQFQQEREIVGIGAMLRRDDQTGALVIIGILPNSPASKAGLTTGLVVQRINGQPTEGKRLAECVALIRGPVGTNLKLELSDLAQTVTNTVELIRARVALPEQRRF